MLDNQVVSRKQDSNLHAFSNCGRRLARSWRLRAVLGCLWCVVLAELSLAQIANAQPGKGSGTFTVTGAVVNSVTGEPIARALVRVPGVVQRTAFTDSEGHFQIEGVQEGSFIEAQKPGYFSPQDSEGGGGNTLRKAGSTLLKLTPLSAVYGRITDTAGQPIEKLPVRLTERAVRDGRLYWNQVGFAQSAEDGRFRFADLMPGAYYLAAGPGSNDVRFVAYDEKEEVHRRARDEKPKIGYPNVYYPGAPDVSSASPIQLVAGQQAEADLSLTAVPIYHVSGTVIGYRIDQGVGLQILELSGRSLPVTVRFAMDTSTFVADDVPAGSYVLKASSQAGDQVLRAEIRLNLSANLDDVHLVLGPAISIPIVVRMEARDSSNLTKPGWSQQRPPASVRLIPAESLAPELRSTFMQQGPGHEVMALADVEPRKYTADVMPWGPWYVQSALYGGTNLLSDDLTVAPGQNYPIEIVLRDDGATLTGHVESSDGTEASATVLALPQSALRRGTKVGRSFPPNGFTMNGLAPGEYLAFAFDHAEKIEYANGDALQPYASQAAHVTLSPNQETHVTLNLIHSRDGE